MKAKIEAGASIELLTKDELSEELDRILTGWRAELARGVKFRQFSAQTNLATGVWRIGGEAGGSGNDMLGPAPGFMWSLTRLAVSGAGFVPANDSWSLFLDTPRPSSFVLLNFGFGDQWDAGTIIVNSGQKLAFTGVGTGTATGDIVVCGGAIEVPVQQAWRLI